MALPQPKTNTQGFTPEEEADLAQAEQEITQQQAESPAEEGVEAPEPEEHQEGADTGTKAIAPAGKPPSGYVPQQALHEIRKELQEEREKRARMEGAWQQIQQRLSAQPQQPAPQQQQGQGQRPNGQIPDFNADPIGHMQGTILALQQELGQLRGHTQQQTQAQQQQNQYMAVMNRYANDLSAMSRATPDFLDAYQWLKADAEAEIDVRFPGIDPARRSQILQSEEENIIANAYATQKNPAQVVYDLAKKRGYKKAAPAQEENKLARLQAGQKASASLSATKGTGAPAGETLTLAALSEMMSSSDPAERAKADEMWDKMASRGLLG